MMDRELRVKFLEFAKEATKLCKFEFVVAFAKQAAELKQRIATYDYAVDDQMRERVDNLLNKLGKAP